MKVAITTSSFGKYDTSPLDRLRREHIQYILNPYGRKLSKAEVVDLAKGVDGIIAGTETLDDWVLNKLHGLKVLSRCGVGMDNVDLDVAASMGIKVFNTPYGPTLAVAELTVGLILDLLRKVAWMDKELKSGTWKKRMGNLLFGKKIGIIGFGRIGKKVGLLLSAFETELAYCDPEPKTCAFNCDNKEFHEILNWADILTLHLSSLTNFCPIIGKKELQLMRMGSWLVNVSRGGVVDEEALYHTLRKGHLSGAALDVFAQEPYTGPLRELDNVILTPHIGSYAKEARVEMELQAVENLIEGLAGSKEAR